MDKKNVSGMAVALAIGAGGMATLTRAVEPEPLILNVSTAVLRDGAGVVETVCAEDGEPATTRCFTDKLPDDEAKEVRARLTSKSLPRWKAHRAGK